MWLIDRAMLVAVDRACLLTSTPLPVPPIQRKASKVRLECDFSPLNHALSDRSTAALGADTGVAGLAPTPDDCGESTALLGTCALAESGEGSSVARRSRSTSTVSYPIFSPRKWIHFVAIASRKAPQPPRCKRSFERFCGPVIPKMRTYGHLT